MTTTQASESLPEPLSGRRVLVVGLGRSGVAAASLCLSRGARVTGTDTRTDAELSEEARRLPLERVLGGHELDFGAFDLIVVSPGVPPRPELALAEARGVPVIGELELASRFVTAPLVAIGGTNGKSTTAALVHHLLSQTGRRSFLGGNFGTPLSEAAGGDWDVLVVEVSSFQLERAPTFHPKVSVLLNITPDHLDRYESFAAYAAAKGNAFVNQREGDFAVAPAGDACCLTQARRGRGATLLSVGPAELGADWVPGAGLVVEARGGAQARYPLTSGSLRGAHNAFNAAAALAAVRSLGVGREELLPALDSFRGLAHRMELCGELEGVRFYDDSKATNVDAAVAALSGLVEERAVLIAGGRDKGGSYAPLAEALGRRGRAVVLLGEASPLIERCLPEGLAREHASDMTDAVRRAFRAAEPGDAVLLSPACSSFDLFTSYAERGARFQAAVAELAREPRERARRSGSVGSAGSASGGCGP